MDSIHVFRVFFYEVHFAKIINIRQNADSVCTFSCIFISLCLLFVNPAIMNEHFTLPYEGGLIEENLPGGILHNYEKIWTEIYPESVPASCAVADLVVSSA